MFKMFKEPWRKHHSQIKQGKTCAKRCGVFEANVERVTCLDCLRALLKKSNTMVDTVFLLQVALQYSKIQKENAKKKKWFHSLDKYGNLKLIHTRRK